jgi:hypothetical protein
MMMLILFLMVNQVLTERMVKLALMELPAQMEAMAIQAVEVDMVMAELCILTQIAHQ